MKKTLTIFLAMVSAGLLVWAAPLLFERKGESSIRQVKNNDGVVETTVHTQDYRILDLFSGDGKYDSRLLDIKKDITNYEGLDGVKGHLQLILSKTAAQKFDTPVWKIAEDATDWAYLFDPELIVTTLSGCCGAMDGARAFNFETGKLIMSYTPMVEEVGAEVAPFSIEIPNTKIRRLIGVITADSSRDFPPELMNRDANGFQAAGIVKYADKNSILQKILIKVKVPENYGTSVSQARWVTSPQSRNETRSGKLTLWDADGRENASSIGGIALELKVYGEQEYSLKLPILSDRFSPSQAEVPADLQLISL